MWSLFTIYSLFFFGTSLKCGVLQRRKGKLLNSCSDCLVSFHSIFSFPSEGMLSPHHHRSGKNKKSLVKTLYFILLSFQREPMLYPNITYSVEPNTNIVYLNRQHSCVTFWKCHIHILAQRADILTDGLIIFLSSSRYVPG